MTMSRDSASARVDDILRNVDWSQVNVPPLRCLDCGKTHVESNGVCWPQGNMGPTRWCRYRPVSP